MTTMHRLIIVAAAGLMAVCADATLVSVTTQTDSNGYFRYTLGAGDEFQRFGGDSNMLAVRVPVLGVVSIVDTPNWRWDTNEAGAILWQYAGSNVCILDDGSVSFAYTSLFADVGPYDDMTVTGAYPRAVVVGELYDTNRILFSSAATGIVVSVNVAGYERAAISGPIIPEPAAAAAAALFVICYSFFVRQVRQV